MATTLAKAYIQIMPSMDGVTQNIQKALGGVDTSRVGQQIGNSFASSFNKSNSSIVSGITSTFNTMTTVASTAIAGVTGAIGKLAMSGGIDRALNIENAKAKLKGLGHSVESVDAIMQNALSSVKGTAFGLGDAATVAAGLVASGIKPGQQLEQVLKSVGDTATIAGMDLSSMGAIFGKVAALGKVTAREILQLSQQGVPALQFLAKHFNTTTEEVQEMVSAGEVGFEDFAAAMQENIGGAALASGNTFTGALANVKAALSRLGEGVASPALESLRQLFTSSIPVIDAFSKAIKPVVDALGTKLQQAVDFILPKLEGLKNMLSNGFNLSSLAPLIPIFALVLGKVSGLARQIPIIGSMLPNLSSGFSKLSGVISGTLQSAFGVMVQGAGSAISNVGKKIFELPATISKANVQIQQLQEKVFDNLPRGLQLNMLKADIQLRSFQSQVTTIMTNVSNKIPQPFHTAFAKVSSIAGSATNSISVAMSKVAAPVGRAVSSIGKGVLSIGSSITGAVMKLGGLGAITATLTGTDMAGFVDGLQQKLANLPAMITSFTTGLSSMTTQIVAQMPTIVQSITAIIPVLLNAITTALPILINAFTTILPQLIPIAVEALLTIVNAIIANLPLLITAALQILMCLAQAIIDNLPLLIGATIYLLTTILTALIDNIDIIIDAGILLIETLVQALVDNIDLVIGATVTIIIKIIETIGRNLPKIIMAAMRIIEALVRRLIENIPKIIEGIGQVLQALGNEIVNFGVKMAEIGLDLIKGLWNGINNAKDWILGKIGEFMGNILNGIKGFFGIKSPSRKMAVIGTYLAQGLGNGIEDGAKYALNPIKDLSSSLLQETHNLQNNMANALTDVFDVNKNLASPLLNMANKVQNNMTDAIGEVFDVDKAVRNNLQTNLKAETRAGELDKLLTQYTLNQQGGHNAQINRPGQSVGQSVVFNININVDSSQKLNEQSLAFAIKDSILPMIGRLS